MYWRKSCACCRNWKSSLHGSRWLILIKLLKIIGYKPTELSIYKGRLKNKKQPTQPIFLAEPLIATTAHPLSRGRELERGQQASRLVILAVRVLGKIAAIRRIPPPQPSPTGEGADCSRFKRYRSSEKRMPEISTAGIFQVAFIAKQMEQTPRAFFQTAFESISGACAARHARGGLGLQPP